MNRYLTFLCAFFTALSFNARAEELTAEVDISWIDPYEKLSPGLSASLRPEILSWNRLSLGAGLAIHISSRFNYDNEGWIEFQPDPIFITDSTKWYYFDENYIEIITYEVFTEGRINLLGDEEEDKWKGYLTLNFGYVANASNRSKNTTLIEQWEYVDTTGVDRYEVVYRDRYNFNYNTEYENNFYIAPGILIGVGNFVFGYRHWINFKDRQLTKGRPAEMMGTIRVGYRFIW